MITPRSSRTFFDALWLAGLEPPTNNAEIGERYLDLLIRGIDHELVTIPAGKHGNFTRAENQRAFVAIKAFLAKHGLTSSISSN